MSTPVATPERPPASGPGTPAPWREVFTGQRGALVIGLLILEALVAIYALVITIILPVIRTELGGTDQYGFIFAAWSLAAVMSIPIAGHASDRFGPRIPLVAAMVIFVVGLAAEGLAPNIPVVILGSFLQGLGGGAFYALSLGAVARTFPESVRARVLALLATMWILPGLVGPKLGTFIAEHFGWRWAFVVPIPVLIVCSILIFPALRGIRPDIDAARVPIRWSVQLAVGAGMLLCGLALVNVWSIGLALVGMVLVVPAGRHLLPPGTIRARRGMPAAAAGMFLLSFAFVGADTFMPLMLTALRSIELSTAGWVISGATVTWAIGSLWQSRTAPRVPLGRLARQGAGLVAIGIAGMAVVGTTDAPIWVAFVAWMITGLGMGIVFPTLPLAAMTQAEAGKEAGQLSSTLLMDMIGVAFGAGVGGVLVAFATVDGGPGLQAGIAGAFLVAFLAIGLLIVIAKRIPGGQGAEVGVGSTPD